MSIFEKTISVLCSEPCKASLDLGHQENPDFQGKQWRSLGSAAHDVPLTPWLQHSPCSMHRGFPQHSLSSAHLWKHQGSRWEITNTASCQSLNVLCQKLRCFVVFVSTEDDPRRLELSRFGLQINCQDFL